MPNGTDEMVGALDPFALAALRQRRAVMPQGGRQEGPTTHVLENYLPHVAGNLAQTLMAPGQVLQGGDPTKGLSDESVEASIPKALGLASLGPMASAPGALAGAASADPMLAALYLRQQNRDKFLRNYHLHDETGQKVGRMETTYNPRNQNVHVEYVQSDKPSPFAEVPGKELAVNANSRTGAFGPKDIKSLLMALRGEHPEALTVSGNRVSGAREAAGSVERLTEPFAQDVNVRMKLPQFNEKQLAAYRATAPQQFESAAAAEARENARIAQLYADFERQRRAPNRGVYPGSVGE